MSVVTSARPTIRKEFDRKLVSGGNVMFELYDETYLGNFDFDTCQEMIVKIGQWIGVNYSDDSLKTIFAETGGHPYIARSLCAVVVADLKTNQVVTKDVEKAIPGTLDRLDYYFRGWWLNLTPVEKQIVRSVLGNLPLPTQTNEEEIDAQQDALRHLRKADLIHRTKQEQWKLTIPLIQKWLEQRQGV